MDQINFWRLIDETRAQSQGYCDRQMELLQRRLVALSPEDIVEFDAILHKLLRQTYTQDLWGAAYVINGGCSDDGFLYFRCWLVTQGESVFQSAINDPDSTLAQVAPASLPDEGSAECEELLYVSAEAYQARTGADLFTLDRSDEAPALTGDPWTEDDLPIRYPQLWAEYGHGYE